MLADTDTHLGDRWVETHPKDRSVSSGRINAGTA